MCGVTLASLFFAVRKLAPVAVRALANPRKCSAKLRLVPHRVFDKGLLLFLFLLVMVAKKMKKNQDEKTMTPSLSLLAKAADLVLTQPVFTTTEVAFKFPCTIHAGDMVMVNTMHTTHSKVIPFDVSLGSNITFSITMASNDRIVGARHVPEAVHKRHASQLSRVTKYIRKRERATVLLHERKHKRDVGLPSLS